MAAVNPCGYLERIVEIKQAHEARRRMESEPLCPKAIDCENENSGTLSWFRSRCRSCSHAYRIYPFRNIGCIKRNAVVCRT
jgi:hypothetical protein